MENNVDILEEGRIVSSRKLTNPKVQFKLDDKFVKKYVKKKVNWGPLGYITYKRTYARAIDSLPARYKKLANKYNITVSEDWWLTCLRVVEGTYQFQEQHCKWNVLTWDANKAQRSAQDMYDRLFTFKFTPPGRGLWMMGTDYVWERGGAALNNCGFVTSEDIDKNFADPFTFLMDMSMLGVGVGGDTLGAGKVKVVYPSIVEETHIVNDTREAWVDLTERVLNAYVGVGTLPKDIDYSRLRAEGEPIKGFGGTSSGPAPLIKLVEELENLLSSRIGEYISSSDIVDIFNLVGKCVVSGNVRRCLPKGTLVHLKKGLTSIEDVNVGDLVLTSSGYKPVLAVLDQGVQKLVEVKTSMGSFKCTANHKLAVMDKPGSYIFKKAEDVKKEDRLIFVEDVVKGEKTYLPDWEYNKPERSTTCKDIVVPDLDKEMAWFIGLFLGYGYVYANKKRNGFNAHISVPINTDEYFDEIYSRVKESIKRFEVNINEVLPTDKDNSLKVRAQSKQLSWYFYDNFKKPKTSLKVPECILKGTEEIRASFLAGLLDADGSTKNRPLNAVTSIYKSFLEQVQIVYASLGIPVRLKDQRKEKGNWKATYSLSVVGERSRELFEERILPFAVKNSIKGKTFRSQNDYGYPSEWIVKDKDIKFTGLWSPSSKQMTVATFKRCGGSIKGLIPVEVTQDTICIDVKDNTYDLTVDTHEFVANGLLVHNSAEIMFGSPNDKEFLDLKNPEVNSSRLMNHGWISNNSINATVGMDYTGVAGRTAKNGEPGYMWLENARSMSRMDEIDYKDTNAKGGNPCQEQTLENKELCCLVETFPANHDTFEDYQKTLKMAYLYAKTVTLIPTHNHDTNRVMLRNRRIGTSMSGIVQAMNKFGRRTFLNWADKGYAYLNDLDKLYSNWLCVPVSIKKTSVKPSGSVSLLSGSTPGIHHPHSEYYWRVIRFSSFHPMLEKLKDHGYPCHKTSEPNTVAVYVPVKEENFERSKTDVTMWEQLEIAAQLQKYWADNAVSVTVTFKPHEAKDIKYALELYETRLKGVSFLPLEDHGYEHAPYQEITKEEYEEAVAKITPVDSFDTTADMMEKFCDGEACEIKL